MALNPLNFNFQPLNFGNPFESLTKGFTQGLQQRREQELFNRQHERSGYENMIKSAEAMNAPQLYQGNAETAQHQGRLFEQKANLYPEESKAEMANKLAQSYLHNQQARQAELINKRYESANNMAPGTVDLRDPSLPANIRNQLNHESDDAMKGAQVGTKILKINNLMRNVVEQNPNLARTFAASVVEAGSGDSQDQIEKSLKNYLVRNITNKKDLAAAQVFAKLGAQLAIELANASPSRDTNQLRNMYALSKASPGNEYEANLAILNQVDNEYKNYPGWHKKLIESRGNFYVPFNPYEPAYPEEKINAFESSPHEMAEPSQEDIISTAKKYNITPEEVIQRLRGTQ